MSFKIWTANLQHGMGTDGVVSFTRQTTAMAGADMVCAQECSVGDLGNWDSGFASNGLVRAIFDEHPGGTGDGNAIWYRPSVFTVEQTYTHDFVTDVVNPTSGSTTLGWNGGDIRRSFVAVKVRFSRYMFYVINVHLVSAQGEDNSNTNLSAMRCGQMRDLVRWTRETLTNGDRFMLGDMNFHSDYPMENPTGFQQDIFHAEYTDLWTQGVAEEKAVAAWGDRGNQGSPDMPISDDTDTHDNRRIDRVYLNKNPRTLVLTQINMPDQRANCSQALTGSPLFCPDTHVNQRWGNRLDLGVRPSDHNFLEVTLDIGPGAPTYIRRTNYSWFPSVKL